MNSMSGSASGQTQVPWIPKLGLFQLELISLPGTFSKDWGTGPGEVKDSEARRMA